MSASPFLRFLSLMGLLLGVGVTQLVSLPPVLTEQQLASPPPKIIRTCCSFGTEVKMAGLPFMKISAITSVEQLGHHVYLGDKTEENGIIYTKKGGFIDLGHLRDQADWTAYLFSLVESREGGALIKQKLGNEGGQKMLWVSVPASMSLTDRVGIAGRIAYDLSIWHEIATWFGASYIPMLPERYSSFSAEDVYSNILGVQLGMAAIKSPLPYEQAMTQLLTLKLKELGAVTSEAETYAAMESVEGVWWTREEKIPSKKLLLERYIDVNNCLNPWLVNRRDTDSTGYEVCIPQFTSDDRNFSNFYRLSFRLNSKFPFKKIFPLRIDRHITSKDFPILVDWIEYEIETEEYKALNKQSRKERRKYKKHYKANKKL